MKVCICNNICNKAFEEAAAKLPPKASGCTIYKEASGGIKPQCATCIPSVKKIRDGQALLPS